MHCTFNGFNVMTKKGGVGLAVADKVRAAATAATHRLAGDRQPCLGACQQE